MKTLQHATRLRDRPILSSALITVAAGLLLPLTFIVDFKQRLDPLVDSRLAVRLVDVAFRMTLGALLVFVVAPLLLGIRRSDKWVSGYLDDMRVSPGYSAARTFAATGLAVAALAGLLFGLALGTGVFENDLGVLVRNDQWVIMLLALVPGIWEELIFRGVILTNLQQHYSVRKAIIISSAMFGLFHLSNFWGSDDVAAVLAGVVAAGLLGIGWGYIVVRTNSAFPAMVLHYAVDVLLDAETFIDPVASDDAVAPVLLGITILWPLLTILIARAMTISQPDPVGYGSR